MSACPFPMGKSLSSARFIAIVINPLAGLAIRWYSKLPCWDVVCCLRRDQQKFHKLCPCQVIFIDDRGMVVGSNK
jgi:hypothetical protein